MSANPIVIEIDSLNKQQIHSIAKKLFQLNDLLDNKNLEVCFIESSELNYDCDEDDEDFGKPMFEAFIQTIDTEEQIDDATTGRYTCYKAVLEELEAFCIEQNKLEEK